MKYDIVQISKIIEGELSLQGQNIELNNVIFDTRKISFAQSSIFFAFTTENNDGHNYINHAYQKGIRNFIVNKIGILKTYDDVNFIIVNDTLFALQKLAKHHRQQFKIPVIGITGSNGKTILKEWLQKALSKKYRVVQSPNSYNSQMGVALSILKINQDHEIAIIEAGISQENEMEKLEQIIKPTIGILTNIGDAHNDGFKDRASKIQEKIKLFPSTKFTILNSEKELIKNAFSKLIHRQTLSWGENSTSEICIESIKKYAYKTEVSITYKNQKYILNIPFTNRQFLELSMHLIACLIHFKFDEIQINNALSELDTLPNRLEIKNGENNCILINDSYSADMTSMQLALEYQEQHSKQLSKIVIFSDFDQQANKENTFKELAVLFRQKKIDQLLAISIDKKYENLFENLNIKFVSNTQDLISFLRSHKLIDKCILIKGSRKFKLENIFDFLSYAVHQTTLETNFSALEKNLNLYKSQLHNSTKVMAVIKADAYGSGSIAMSEFLEQKGVDYLAVALIDEAIKIRRSGCNIPLMVFNIHNDSFRKLWDYNLEPEVYSIALFRSLSEFAKSQNSVLNIHLKLDTGMHRLGIEKEEIEELLQIIDTPNIHIVSIFSHLSASENERLDDFTKSQVQEFTTMYSQISGSLNYNPDRHILNTGGVIRFPQYQFEMIRLGLGLYGIDETRSVENKLQKVHSLHAKVLQIKYLKKGESTGYGRSGLVNTATTIATISIGYADGLMRVCGNGHFSVYLNGHLCPIIGNICMDVMMIDVTHVPEVKVYDKVEIFGQNIQLEDLAHACNTISYEIISRISPRVKRIYTYD